MKQLIIDGYNLLLSNKLDIPAHLPFDARRETMIRILQQYASTHRSNITLVFDTSQRHPKHYSDSSNLKIRFSAPSQEADDVIRKLIRKHRKPSELTVVSSDREIRFTARDHGAASLSSHDFATIISNSHSTPAPNDHTDLSRQKFESDIGEDEVSYWKSLFDEDNDDE